MKNTDDRRQSHGGIKRRLTGVVLVPSVALVVLWLVASTTAVYNGFYLRAVAVGVEEVSIPGVDFLASAQRERSLSLHHLGPFGAHRDQLDEQRAHTDRSLGAMRRAADPLLEQSPADVQERMREFDETIGELPRIRAMIDERRVSGEQTYAYYNEFMTAGTQLFETQARTVPDFVSGQGGLLATQFFVSSDLMSRSASLISNGFSTSTFTARTHAEYSRLIGAYHHTADSTAAAAPPEVRERYQQLVDSPAYRRLLDWEEQLLSEGEWATAPELPFNQQQWLETTQEVATGLSGLTVAQAEHASTLALEHSTDELASSLIGSLLALLAGTATITVAARVAHRIAARLTLLHEETLDVTHTRLPEVVERLRKGERVDVESEVAWLDYGNDEIGQVASAFNTAQQTAVAAAVREAHAREGANNVFLGIAHRSQSLMRRQLQLLDELERHEEDPKQMQTLFQLDHLATRARRNAENLIMLGGEQPGRKWSKPVKLAEIVGGAIAETKHYARVRPERITDVALLGTAVADTIHLIAELIDNATTFSPPHSQVTVRSQSVARGVVIEVEDHGLGLEDHERDTANAMLNDPPEFDAMALRQETRLGLFVVARLAVKHGIGVELRRSAYGGTLAVVLLPVELIVPLPSSRTAGLPAGTDAEGTRPPAAGSSTTSNLLVPTHSSAERSDLLQFWDESAKALIAEQAGPPAATTAEPLHLDNEGTPPPPQTKQDTNGSPGEDADEVCWPSTDPTEHDPRPALPRRRKQANLAPQLRGAPTNDAPQNDVKPGRSADEIRGLMTAFQRASEKARAEESASRQDNTKGNTSSPSQSED